jgi:hypothetical protein
MVVSSVSPKRAASICMSFEVLAALKSIYSMTDDLEFWPVFPRWYTLATPPSKRTSGVLYAAMNGLKDPTI